MNNAIQGEIGGYALQKSGQVKVVVYVDGMFASTVASNFKNGTQVAIAVLVDPETGEIQE